MLSHERSKGSPHDSDPEWTLAGLEAWCAPLPLCGGGGGSQSLPACPGGIAPWPSKPVARCVNPSVYPTGVARELGIGSLGTSPDGCRGELRLYRTSTATIHEEGKYPNDQNKSIRSSIPLDVHLSQPC